MQLKSIVLALPRYRGVQSEPLIVLYLMSLLIIEYRFQNYAQLYLLPNEIHNV